MVAARMHLLPTLTMAFATSPPLLLLLLLLLLTRRSPKCNAPQPSIAIAPYPMPLWTSGPICAPRQYPLLTAGQPIGQCSQMIPSFAAPSSLSDDATDAFGVPASALPATCHLRAQQAKPAACPACPACACIARFNHILSTSHPRRLCLK